MKMSHTVLAVLSISALLLGASTRVLAFEYPTVDRVEFVEFCAMEHSTKPHQEMVYKCSCLIDQFAKQVSYDDYVDLSTAFKAFSMAGEHGNMIRDSSTGIELNKRYKSIMAAAKTSCFIQ
jgi:hypothetical protein